MGIDDLDRQILKYLQEDGRISYVTLANQLNVSEGTIRKRVKKLEENNILQIVGVTDPFKVGLDTVAFLWLEVQRGQVNNVIEKLKEVVSIRYLAVTTGSYDLVAMVVLPNREELIKLLNEQVPSIEGIISTETSIILQIHKQIYNWIPFKESKGGTASV
ncbi:MAG: Lrp/AsnC family transcriptional regulator [Firmicutes bacterium]|nr:Lrp/AsnC family transcriptional regulator [Bacillota bacterium]